MRKPLVITILAKSTAHTLPDYLKAITSQTEVNSDTIFYIKTNDNTDDTDEVLRDWYLKWNWKWKMVFDDTSINENLKNYANHEWNVERFKTLAKIRKHSIDFAISERADYFISDCDNIIIPDTIKSIRETGLPVIAPLLQLATMGNTYTNTHACVTDTGYFQECQLNSDIFHRRIRGLIEVPVVHATYLIRNEYLQYVNYDDNSDRYEYVIFSDELRKAGISQYVDTRKVYGKMFFAQNKEGFDTEWNMADTPQILKMYR
jgi:hypothetical protein